MEVGWVNQNSNVFEKEVFMILQMPSRAYLSADLSNFLRRFNQSFNSSNAWVS